MVEGKVYRRHWCAKMVLFRTGDSGDTVGASGLQTDMMIDKNE